MARRVWHWELTCSILICSGPASWHPVPGPAACLEEWLRYPESDRQNLVRESGFRGDLVLQTSNTTVIAMPQKPSFLITAFEEGAEFTASLRALLANWQRLVTESTFQAKEQIVAARESSENIRDPGRD